MPYPMPQQMSPMPEEGAPPQPTGPTGPTSPPTAQGLLGPQQPQAAPAASPVTPEDHVESLLSQFRDLSMSIQGIARQYPAAQQDLAIANDALINAMTKVVASMSAESSSAPAVLA